MSQNCYGKRRRSKVVLNWPRGESEVTDLAGEKRLLSFWPVFGTRPGRSRAAQTKLRRVKHLGRHVGGQGPLLPQGRYEASRWRCPNHPCFLFLILASRSASSTRRRLKLGSSSIRFTVPGAKPQAMHKTQRVGSPSGCPYIAGPAPHVHGLAPAACIKSASSRNDRATRLHHTSQRGSQQPQRDGHAPRTRATARAVKHACRRMEETPSRAGM